MANVVKYDATQHSVDSVTVFQADRAEITRKIKVPLKNGQNDVEVRNLPTCLDEGSIRVDGIGNAVIFDVVYHPPPRADSSRETDPDVIKLRKQKNELTSQLAVHKRQAEILSEYSKTLDGKDTKADQLDSFLDIYATRQSTIDAKIVDLEEELVSVESEIEKAQKHVGKDMDSVRLRGTRLTIVVLASGDGEAELSLMYVVSNARWTPHYDLRAAIATDAKSQPSVELHYRASISQHTGEDWDGVALTLSTASPLTGTDVPQLEPYWVGERQMYARAMSKARRNTLSLPSFSGGKAGSPPARLPPPQDDIPFYCIGFKSATVDDGYGYAESTPPGFFRAQDSEAMEGALSTTFGIPGLSTIPSDKLDLDGDSDDLQTHKVSIAELEFKSVELEWIAVPKDVPSAFLQCKTKNTSKYVLLPGPANVFMNNNFVAKSRVPHVSPQESFTASLGVDPAVRVTYHPQSRKTRSSGGGVLSSKHIVTSLEQSITIKNTRLTVLHRLLVEDQIPVSSDARIKVTLKEPRELANTSKMSASSIGVQLSKGVRVRWLPRNNEGNASAKAANATTTSNEGLDAESAQGMLEWICEVEPGSSVDLVLAWEVSAPADLRWARR